MIKNIITVLASSLITIYFINFAMMTYNVFYVERLSPKYILQNAVTSAGLTWDPRSAGKVLRDLLEENKKAVPNYTPRRTRDYFKGLAYQALGGHSFATVILCNEFGTWLTYESDRFGFNNDDAIHDSPRINVALLGDSYAQGYCVSRENNIAGQLNKQRVTTVNFGMSGNGFLSYLATFMEYVSPKKIKTTVLVWFYNDMPDTEGESLYANLRYYLEHGKIRDLRKQQTQIDAKLNEILVENPPIKKGNINWSAYLRGVITLSAARSTIESALGIVLSPQRYDGEGNITASSFLIMKKVLKLMLDKVKSWQGEIVVVVLTPYGGNPPEFSHQISEMRKHFSDEKHFLISDFEPIYMKYGGKKLYALGLNGSHFNQYGYCLFAEHLAGILKGLKSSNVSSNFNYDQC